MQRSGDLPGIPTVKETGIGDFDASTTYAVFAPAGTPKEVVDRLHAEIKKALDDEQRAAEAARRRRRARHRHARRTSPRCWRGASRNGPTSIKSAGIKIN